MIAADHYKAHTGREGYSPTTGNPTPHFIQWLETMVERNEERHPTPVPCSATSYVPVDSLNHFLVSYIKTKPEPAHFAFWRHDCRGYTVWINEAGRYTEAEAMKVAHRDSNSVAIPIADMHKLFKTTEGGGMIHYSGDNAKALDKLNSTRPPAPKK